MTKYWTEAPLLDRFGRRLPQNFRTRERFYGSHAPFASTVTSIEPFPRRPAALVPDVPEALVAKQRLAPRSCPDRKAGTVVERAKQTAWPDYNRNRR
jgi:hypothetical protein